ncbi:MAG: LysR family transcriptional regulator [Myxococcales bacterium]|nr:LysR family transcriptional regulator [Myxococcales bacterium]
MSAWLNYHHLFYFWRVARAGSIVAAARELRLSHSTLSAQIRELGEALGGPLFDRRGRGLVLTALGEEASSYADDIFRLGSELFEVAQGRRPSNSRLPVKVGVVPMFPPGLVYRLIAPALAQSRGVPISIRREPGSKLFEELAFGRIHVALTDGPPPESDRTRLHAHRLGSSAIAIYAAPRLFTRYSKGFPACLDGAPLLLPAQGSSLRRVIDRWFSERALRPSIAFEADDAAMLRVFGARGLGLFPVRTALRAEVEDSLGVRMVGALSGAEEVHYAVSLERRVRHPFVAALVERARANL